MIDARRKSILADSVGPGSSARARDIAASARMVYMADLLLELKDMATDEGHATLAGLLALAHMEALSKS